jgi:acetyl-CoA synthetase
MTKLYEVPAEFAARTRIRREDYDRLYEESVRDPDGFWARMGERINWIRPYTRVKDVSYDAANFHIRWFDDGQLNVAANCLDRHLATRGDKTAILWEGDDPNESDAHHLPRAVPPGLPARQRAARRSACRRATGSRSTCR